MRQAKNDKKNATCSILLYDSRCEPVWKKISGTFERYRSNFKKRFHEEFVDFNC
jgi:hypothetical protein